jgi:hypothetical protein
MAPWWGDADGAPVTPFSSGRLIAINAFLQCLQVHQQILNGKSGLAKHNMNNAGFVGPKF